MSIPFRLAILAILAITAQKAQADIDWHVQLREAHAIATAQGKPLLLHFYADRCVWCEKLEKGAFASPIVEDAIHADFVPVKVHANTSPSLAKMFKVDKFPSDVVVTPTGKTISHSVSPQDVTRYVEMLQNALETLETTSNPSAEVGNAEIPSKSEMESDLDPTNEQEGDAVDDETAEPAAVSVSEGHRTTPEDASKVTYATLGGSPQKNESEAGLTPEISPPEYATLETPIYDPSSESKPAAVQIDADLSPNGSAFALPEDALSSESVAKTDPSAEGTATSKIILPTEEFSAEGKSPQNNAISSNVNTAADPQFEHASANISEDAAISAEAGVNLASAEISSRSERSKDGNQNLALALEGYCAVTVIEEDQWTEGDPTLSVIHLGRLYLFADEAKRDRFLSNPIPFTPVLNEIDPVVFFEERRVVPGKREWGMKDPIHQRMFFFADEASMNHFYREYERYTQSAIDLMDRAVKESNPVQ